jgi:hypothetical protein
MADHTSVENPLVAEPVAKLELPFANWSSSRSTRAAGDTIRLACLRSMSPTRSASPVRCSPLVRMKSAGASSRWRMRSVRWRARSRPGIKGSR